MRKSDALDDGDDVSKARPGFAFEVDSSVHAKAPYRATEKEAPYICRNGEFSPAAGAFFAHLPPHIQQQYLRNKESAEAEEGDKQAEEAEDEAQEKDDDDEEEEFVLGQFVRFCRLEKAKELNGSKAKVIGFESDSKGTPRVLVLLTSPLPASAEDGAEGGCRDATRATCQRVMKLKHASLISEARLEELKQRARREHAVLARRAAEADSAAADAACFKENSKDIKSGKLNNLNWGPQDMANFTANVLQEEVNRPPMQNEKLYRNFIPQAKGMFADLETTQRAALTAKQRAQAELFARVHDGELDSDEEELRRYEEADDEERGTKSKSCVLRLFQLIDKDGNGKIGHPEMQAFIKRNINTAVTLGPRIHVYQP